MSAGPRQGGPGGGKANAEAAAAALFQNAVQAFQSGNLALAEQGCRQILAQFPANPSALHLLGLIAARTGHFAEAETLIRRSLSQNPRDPDAHNSLGGVLIELKQYDAALRMLDDALKLRAAFPHALANRARAMLDLRRFAEAADAARRAVAIAPDFFDAWTHLGNALLKMKQLYEAEDAFQHAAALQPRHPGAHINLGTVAAERKNLVTAEDEFRQALAADPNNTQALVGLGHALYSGGRFVEAEAAIKRALDRAPEDRDGLQAMADLELERGQHEAALAILDRAVALYPDLAEIRMARGQAYFASGRGAEAEHELNTVIELDPAHPGAYASLLESRDPPPDDPLVGRAEALLASGKVLGAPDRALLHMGLGKAYLKGADSDRAFTHLNAGNRLERAGFDFDIAAAERQLAAIAQHCGPGLFARLNGAGVASELPVFIIGMPRSGTTLIEQILASHPNVWGAGELATVSRLLHDLPAPGYPVLMDTADPALLQKFGRGYLAEVEPMARGRARLVDKMPGNFVNAGAIALAMTGARIIHCQRDAVDTCLSCYSIIFAGDVPYTYDLTELGRYWKAYDRLMAHWRTVLPPDRFIEVRYEDVVADLEIQARRLIGFIGLPWNDACLAFHKTDRVVRTASVNQVRKPIYRQSVRRWERHARNLRPLLDALGLDLPAEVGQA